MHQLARARSRALASMLAAALISAGCSSDTSAPTQPGTGALTVNVSGLPSGAAAAVRVAGPSGYLNTVTHTSTLSNLAPGNYVLTATTVAANNTNYSPSPSSETVTIADDATPVPTS